MTPESNKDERYRALLEVPETIASHRDLSALFHDLAKTLHRLVHFEYLNLLLYDPAPTACGSTCSRLPPP
jgi:hypothetical protein